MFARPEAARPRPRPSERPDPKPWLVLWSAGAAVRVAALFLPRFDPVTSAFPAGRAIAAALAAGQGFSAHTPAGLAPTIAAPPFAPWLLSGMLRLPVPEPMGAWVALALVGALTPVVIAALGAGVYGGGAGRWAGWIAAFDPFLVWAPLVECVAALALGVALLATAGWVKTPRPGRALGVGLLWGVGALTHPALLGLAALVTAWAWVPLGLTVAPGDRLRQVGLVLVGLSIVVLPWTARNGAVAHAFVPVNTGNGVALLAASSHEAWTDPALAGAPAPQPLPVLAGAAAEATADRVAFAMATAHMRDHTAESLPVLGARVLSFCLGPRGTLPLAITAWLLLPCALWGAARTMTGARRMFQSLPLVVALWFIARALVYGADAAARAPVEPVLALIAAVGLDDVRRRTRARAHGFTVIEGRGARRPAGR